MLHLSLDLLFSNRLWTFFVLSSVCLLFTCYFNKSFLAGRSFESFAVKICSSFYGGLGFRSAVCIESHLV